MSDLAIMERLSKEGRSLLVHSQHLVVEEIIDLCRNGYLIRFHSFHKNWWFVKLQHLSNGRILSVKWEPGEYSIYEGKTLLKTVGCISD